MRGAALIGTTAVIFIACVFCGAGPALAQAGPQGAASEAPRKHRARVHAQAAVRAFYSSNLFLEREKRLPLFESERGPGERYAGMQGPSDYVTEPSLEAGMSWKLGHGKKLALSVDGAYAVHVHNAIANYATLGAQARYWLGKRDRLSYRAELLPSRFRKNYTYAKAAGERFFSRADYLQLEQKLGYRHRWNKRFRSDVGAALELRRFEQPFENRDYNKYAAELSTAYAPVRLLEVELGVDVALLLTPGDPELDAYPIDRSRHDVEPFVALTFDLPRGFTAAAEAALRLRSYDTTERADGARFGRNDYRIQLGAEIGKRFGKLLWVSVYASYADNDAVRVDPSADPDEYGYREAQVGLSVAVSPSWGLFPRRGTPAVKAE